MQDGDPRLVPKLNIYAKHTFDPSYNAQNLKPPSIDIENSYGYIFWDGHILCSQINLGEI